MNRACNGDQRLNVIIGDANLVEAKLLSIFLAQQNCEVNVTQTGEAVVSAALGGAPVDVAIINCALNGSLGGMDATRKMRQAGFQGVIIATTTDATVSLRNEWKAAGCNALLQKPISIDTMMMVIWESVN